MPLRDDRSSGRPAGGDAGFALVVVVLALGLLAAAILTFSQAVRSHLRTVTAAAAAARAEALADGGVELALADLLAVRESRTLKRRFPIDGTSVACAAGSGGRLVVRVEDEAGRVDLNAASEALLLALLRGHGVGEDAAARIADRIIDARDRDGERRPHGAERPDYEAAGLSGPKNAPFDAIDELGQVLGIDGATVDRLRPAITVHSGMAGIDPRVMPQDRVKALASGFGLVSSGLEAVGLPADRGGLPSRLVEVSPQQVFRITVDARVADGGRFTREAIVDLGPRRGQGHQFRRWSRVGALEPVADPASPMAPSVSPRAAGASAPPPC